MRSIKSVFLFALFIVFMAAGMAQANDAKPIYKNVYFDCADFESVEAVKVPAGAYQVTSYGGQCGRDCYVTRLNFTATGQSKFYELQSGLVGKQAVFHVNNTEVTRNVAPYPEVLPMSFLGDLEVSQLFSTQAAAIAKGQNVCPRLQVAR